MIGDLSHVKYQQVWGVGSEQQPLILGSLQAPLETQWLGNYALLPGAVAAAPRSEEMQEVMVDPLLVAVLVKPALISASNCLRIWWQVCSSTENCK